MNLINEPLTGEQNESSPRPSFNLLVFLAWAAITVVLAAGAFWLGSRRPVGPGVNSPEVGFTRDMRTHHAQAVDMAVLIRDRTSDPDIRQLALDILLTQQAQIGQMQGWLNVWGYPIASTQPAMGWMGMPTTGLMPGMATSEQLNQLRALDGLEAERLFLSLMVTHHLGGVEMGQAALERVQQPEVRALAQSIVDAQTYEIDVMQSLLLQREGVPVEEEDMQSGMPAH